MIRFKLDGDVYPTPLRYREMRLVHKRDEAIRGLMYGFNATVEFYGTGKDLLRTAYDSSPCGWAEVDIEWRAIASDAWEVLALGRIYLNEIEWDLLKGTAVCKIADRSFNSVIATNKGVKGYCNVPLSKAGGDITGHEAPAYDLKIPDAVTGLYSYSGKAYKVYDVLRWAVAFMSGGEVGFESAAFGVGGDYEFYAIASGYNIRVNDDSPAPYISFEELYTDLAKLFCLSFWIEDVGGVPTIRIEVENDTFSDTSSTSIGGLYKVRESLFEDRFYAHVFCGSVTTQGADGGTYKYPDVRLLSHKSEEYNTQIDCNLDTSLNLRVATLVTDANVIDDLVRVSPTESKNDERVFIINYFDDSGTMNAVRSEFKDSAGTVFAHYVNDSLLNERVLNRWARHIPVGAANYYDASDYTCVATDSGSIVTSGLVAPIVYDPGKVTFDTDVSDPGAAFNTVSSFYEVPADGIYTFFANFRMTFDGVWSGNSLVSLQVIIVRWDSAVATRLGEVINKNTWVVPTGTPWRVPNNWGTLYCGAGDKIGIYIEAHADGFTQGVLVAGGGSDPGRTFNIDSGRFECTWFSVGGGSVTTSAIEYLRVRLHEFEKPIEKDEYDAIIAAPTSAIALELPSGTIPAYIEEITWNPENKRATFKLLSSRSNPTSTS